MLRLVLTSLPFALAAAAAPAQGRLLIVDELLGPGAGFAQIQDAVDAARSGDRISVRPGTYAQFVVDGKAISVLGGPGVVVRFSGSGGGAPSITVSVVNIPAGAQCAVSGMSIAPQLFGAPFSAVDCAGRVLLQDLQSGRGSALGATVTRCSQILLNQCSIETAMRVRDSTAVIADCSFLAVSAFGAAPGLLLENSDTTVSRTSSTGSNNPFAAPGPGIDLVGGKLTLTDDGSSVIASGNASFFGSVPAVAGTGVVDIDPAVVLQPSRTSPALAATLQVNTVAIPTLRATTGPIGGTTTVDLFGRPGDLFVLLVALPGDPISYPGIRGSFWLALQTAVLVSAGALDATGRVTVQFPVPGSTQLVGLRLGWQAAAGVAGGFAASNPGWYEYWM